MENTRTVVSLGLKLRADAKVRVRMPLQSVTFALPPSNTAGVVKEIIAEELNVKQVIDVVDAGTLATRIVQVDARKVGPRLGSKVQDLIRAGKAGQFSEKDGAIVLAGETLAAGEASIVYQGKEGHAVAADRGIVVTIDATQTEALILEGQARELIHWIQSERKEAGLEFTDTIELELTGAEALLESHKELILDETRAELKKNKGKKLETTLGDLTVSMRFEKKGK
jgi:isoleucyl-tRNA synthetase